MKSLPEKEILFNRYYAGEMDKAELTVLVKRLMLERELREWFTFQLEFFIIYKEQQKKTGH